MIAFRKGFLSPHLLILSGAARFVPRSGRADWLQDWESELWYFLREGDHARPSWAEFRFCLGAFPDALWLRCDGLAADFRGNAWLATPRRCLLFLAALMAAMVSSLLYQPRLLSDMLSQGFFLMTNFLMLASLAVVPAIMSFRMGRTSGAHAGRLRWWGFLLMKFGLVAPVIAGFIFYSFRMPIPGAPMLVDVIFAGCVVVCRWILLDQRRRCPMCLHVLMKPARVGRPFRMFQEWYGTRYSCPAGHGHLYVSEMRMSDAAPHWSAS